MAQAQLEPESADARDAGDRAAGFAPAPRFPATVIEPRSGWPSFNLADLWTYRDLLQQLTWRNVKVRYKQTVLGVAWAVLQPLLWMIVLTWTFSRWIPAATGDVPAPLFLFSGVLPWIYFQTAVAAAANSVVTSEGLVTKVYFPRLVIPLAAIAAALVDFAIAFVLLVLLMFWYRIVPSAAILLVPAAVALLTVAAIGFGTLIAALTVSYRDFRHAIGFLLQIWMIATPTIYYNVRPSASTLTAAQTRSAERVDLADRSTSAATVSGKSASRQPGWLARINPVAAPIDFFRSTTLGLPIEWGALLTSALVNLVLCAAGILYYRRVEDAFADVI